MTHSDPNTGDDTKTLGMSLDSASDDSDTIVEQTTTPGLSLLGRPLPGVDRCDCRIQALDAIRQEIATWTIGTVPDLEVWAHGVAAWIAELPTDDLRTFWPGLLALDLHDHTGMTISRASLLIQRHVAVRLARKEGEQ